MQVAIRLVVVPDYLDYGQVLFSLEKTQEVWNAQRTKRPYGCLCTRLGTDSTVNSMEDESMYAKRFMHLLPLMLG